MKLGRWIMACAGLLGIVCLGIAIFLLFTVSRPYTPIRSYNLDVLPQEVCTTQVVDVQIKAHISPPVETLIVDPTWAKANAEAFQEEPVAEFTGDQLPVKIDRVSPLTHISPDTPGIWRLEESLVAEGPQGGITRTQDYRVVDQTPTRVVECGK